MKQITYKTLTLFTVLYMLSGCAALETSVSKRNLDVQTKMSTTVFMEPVEDDKLKKIYVQTRNSSDKQTFQINQNLKQTLQNKGFKIVNKSSEANYQLQVNVLQVGKMDPSAAEAATYRGYGYEGASIGAGAVYLAGGNSAQIFGGAILGGITSIVADSVVKDVSFSVITDVQIKAKENSEWKTYQTRILSSANKVNLEFAQAEPELQKALVQSIAGIF